MATLARFPAPQRTWSLANQDSAGGFDADDLIRTLSERELALLLRTVDLVVLSQAFSRERLQYALQISAKEAAQMTVLLELLGVISTYEVEGQREVLAELHQLPVLLVRLRIRPEPAAAVA